MVNKRVVITGMGVVSSIGLGRKKFWQGLLDGASGIKPISLFKPFDRYYNLACEIKNLDFARYLGHRGLMYLDRSTKLLLIAVKLGLKDYRFNFDKIKESNIGIVVGTDGGHLESNFRFHRLVLTKGPHEVNPMDFPTTLANFATSQVSIRYGLTGLNTTIARGFSSGLDAISYAVSMIKNYKIKTILAGAVENLCMELYTLFYIKKWLLKNTKQTSKGFVLGEGACVLVLEDIKSAYKRRANILAEVIGCGFSFGGSKESIKKAIYSALEDAGLKPHQIDYICANANGSTKDKQEAEVIMEIFRNNGKLIISSIKPMIGECFGATSAMQVASTCLSLSQGLIPPTVNFRKSDTNFGRIGIYNKKVRKKIGIAMVNSFGLDGNNACLILKKAS